MSRVRRHTEQSKFPAQELVTTGVDMLESVVCYISLWCGARRDGSMVSMSVGAMPPHYFQLYRGCFISLPLHDSTPTAVKAKTGFD